ncbi:MAG: hypothetical protein ACK5CL_05995 [Sphingomonadales bacterium]
MKSNNSLYLSLLVAVVLAGSCKKSPEIDGAPSSTAIETTFKGKIDIKNPLS